MDSENWENVKAQEYLQRQQLDADTIKYAQPMLEEVQRAQSILVEQTNPNKVLEEIENKLRGIRKMPDGTSKQTKFGRIMNDEGIDKIIFLMSSVVNQNTILSHLEDKEITRIILHLSYDLIDDLTMNWEEYEMKEEMKDYVINAVIIPAFMSLKRALGQNEKNWLGKVSVESITNASMPMGKPKKDSWLRRFKL